MEKLPPLDYLRINGEDVQTIQSHIKLTDILDYNGVVRNMHIAKWVASSPELLEYPAYCVNPGIAGTAQHINGKYPVMPKPALTADDHIILGIFRAGYPYKTPSQLGVQDITDAYYSTQCAIWHFIQNGSDESTLNVWKAHSGDTTRNNQILAAMKQIYLAGKANPYYPPEISFTAEPLDPLNDGRAIKDGDWVVNEYAVSSTHPYTYYRIGFWDSGIFDLIYQGKVKITDLHGNTINPQMYVAGLWDNNLAFKVPATQGFKIWYDLELARENRSVYYGMVVSICDVEMEYTAAYIGTPAIDGNWQGYAYAFVPSQGDGTLFKYDYFEETPKLGNLSVEKIDAKTHQKVKGTIFQIKGITDGQNTHINFTVTASAGATIPQTDGAASILVADGSIKLTDIPIGHYEITEISPPPNYAPPEQRTQTVEVVADANIHAKVTFANQPYGALKIRKVDSTDTSRGLDGVVLRIRNETLGYDRQFTTANGGNINATGLEPADYFVTEVATIPGYELSTETVVIPVRYGEIAEALFTNKPYGGIIVTKVDSITGKHLPGANIMITSLTTGQTWDVITGSDGTASVDLPPGEYTVQEKNAPPGYELNSCPQTIIVLPGETSYVKIQNNPFGSLLITKIDSKIGQPMAGARLRIYNDTLNYDKTKTTDSNGQIHLTDLKPGDYTIIEVATIPGYELSKEVLTRTVAYGQETTVVFTNEPKGSVTVIKVDSITGEHLPGANIKLTDLATGQTWDLITGADGTATVENLLAGQYTFQEQNPPKGYELNNQVFPVTVVNGENSSVKIQNNPLGKLEIIKVSSLDSTVTLAGVKLRVQNTALSFDRTYTTDQNGRIFIEDLLPGDYAVSEIATIPGYKLSTETVVATVNYGKTTPVVFKNEPLPYIEILKIDSQNNRPIEGAVFRVTNRNTQQNYNVTTDADGRILIEDVEVGWYDVQEITPPTGYVPDYTVHSVYADIGKHGQITIKNTKMPSLTVLKVDKDTQKLLSGGIFTVEKIGEPNNGAITGSPFTTGTDGKIHIPELMPGSYRITEIQAPFGYNLSENNSQIITMVAGQDNVLKFENTRQPAFVLTKTDSKTGKPIPGAAFTIEKLDNPGKGFVTGTPLYTDEQGQIMISNLRSGMYRITEIEPAPGYGLPEIRTWEINIIENQDYSLKVKNTRLPSLVINKIDGLTYKGIPNTYFEVYYAVNGSFYGDVRSLGTYKTDSNGQIIIPNCLPGWYRYVEVRPAQGYSKPSNPVHDVFLKLGDNAYSGIGGKAWESEILSQKNGVGYEMQTFSAPVNAQQTGSSQKPAEDQQDKKAVVEAQHDSVAGLKAEETPKPPASDNQTDLTPTVPNIPFLIETLPNGKFIVYIVT